MPDENARLHYEVVKELLNNTFGKNVDLVGCEIGVSSGLMEHHLLYEFPRLRMYAIDTDINSLGSVSEELKKRIIFINKCSDDAVKDIKEKLDFVYIDGGHTYEQCKRDIEHYLPLIKKGGIIGGHDYHTAWGVIQAVQETLGDVILGDNLTWWKPL